MDMVPSGQATSQQVTSIGFDGTRRDVAKIAVKNFLLSLSTLGVYRFWGRTRLRRYLWSRTSLMGDRFEYTGTGGEKMRGFIVAFLLFFGIGLGSTLIKILAGFEDDSVAGHSLNVANALIFLFLWQYGAYRARGYRLSRTNWRGVRGGQSGSPWRYATFSWLFLLLSALTAGLAYPLLRHWQQSYKISRTRFGNAHFAYDGRAAPLFKIWAPYWLASAVSAGLMIWSSTSLGPFLIWSLFLFAFYRAQEFRHFVAHTRVAGMQFESQLDFKMLWKPISLFVFAAGISVITLGGVLLGMGFLPFLTGESAPPAVMAMAPFAILLSVFIAVPFLSILRTVLLTVPLFAAAVRSTRIIGGEALAGVRQDPDPLRRHGGEGLASAYDLGSV
jgi:uncharacterized membrane protein YjgN (DUF898 family)